MPYLKEKRWGILEESFEIIKKNHTSRITTLLVILIALLLSIGLIGNGTINTLVFLLLLSGMMSSISCIYIIPLFIKVSKVSN